MTKPGQSFAGYVVENELGRGGEAMVYLARGAGRTPELVAVKVLDDDHRTPQASPGWPGNTASPTGCATATS